jgi:hypothetical protein
VEPAGTSFISTSPLARNVGCNATIAGAAAVPAAVAAAPPIGELAGVAATPSSSVTSMFCAARASVSP